MRRGESCQNRFTLDRHDIDIVYTGRFSAAISDIHRTINQSDEARGMARMNIGRSRIATTAD